MRFKNIQPGLNAPLPRLDDDDDDEGEEAQETTSGKKESSVSLLIQKRFLNQRKLFLWGPVTDETAKELSEKLLYLESTAPGKEITFYMNTPGGSITAGMAVFDTMKLISSPITIVVTGMAASMGSILLCAAAKGRMPEPTSSRIKNALKGGFISLVREISSMFYENTTFSQSRIAKCLPPPSGICVGNTHPLFLLHRQRNSGFYSLWFSSSAQR